MVELLAVIAILAIIVLLSLPNVLKVFNHIKKNIFLTEVKTIYSESINKYLMESLDGNYIEIISSSGENKLSLDGKSIDYCVILDYQGEVSSIKVSDGDYNVDYSGNNINDIVLESINEGNLDLSECTISAPRSCTYDGELVPGATYVDGQYTYRYKKEKIHDYDDSGDEFHWRDINADGWGVILTDSESTDSVTTKLCSSINDKPIVSMALMFYESKASSVNLSTFDTSNVINMWGTFASMNVDRLDVSNLNTSNVEDMHSMFFNNKSPEIIGISNLDTHKVKYMQQMFQFTEIPSLDLSSWDTRNVENMWGMFSGTKLTSLDVSSFDTSKVIDMRVMFNSIKVPIIDISSFDTSNVEDMHQMFYEVESNAILVGNKWDTSKVTRSDGMFENSEYLPNYSTSNPFDITMARSKCNGGYLTVIGESC